jgi:hypothetical protein
MRHHLFAAATLVAANASAGPSTQPIGDFFGLFVDASVAQEQRLCSARLPETAAEWKADAERWRTANAEPLRQLRETGQAVHKLTTLHAFEAPASVSLTDRETRASMYGSFQMLAVAQPATELATANDTQAAERCQNWRAAIAPGGPLETGLPAAIDGARRLLQSAAQDRGR